MEANSITVERCADTAEIPVYLRGGRFLLRTSSMQVTLRAENGTKLTYAMTRDDFTELLVRAALLKCDG